MLVKDPASVPLGEALAIVAEQVPDRPALLGERRQLTWRELDREVNQLANLLTKIGLVAGDAVGIVTTKREEVTILFLAAARIGAIAAPVNFKLVPDHVKNQFKTSKLVAVLAEKQFDDLIEHIVPELKRPDCIVYVGGMGRLAGTDYAEIASQSDSAPAHRARPDDVCYYNYTSGTTGNPKGAEATHREIMVNALSGIEGFGFTGDDVFLGMFSVFSHPHELFHRSLLVGGAFVIWDTLSPRVVCEVVERFKISWMMAVPSFYEMMLDHGGPGRADISSLRILEAGGAPVPAETLHRIESSYNATMMPVWGSTETCGVALAMPPGEARKPGASGRAAPYYKIRVVNDAGEDVPHGTIGEMIVQGEAVSKGYVNADEETAKHFRNGWYHTSDLVKSDEEGFLYFIGRQAEMMKVGGIRVYPLEIERAVREHPEVRDVLVVRALERLRGEVPRAIVTTLPGATVNANGIKKWCREHLATYKVPRIVEFWSELPTLPNGKIDRKGAAASEVDPKRDDRV